MSDEEYLELGDFISFGEFSFINYREGEEELLRPRLEELGFSDIRFSMGECDSFGPLTRVVHARNGKGTPMQFIYG